MTDLTPRKATGSVFGWLPDRPNKQDYRLVRDHISQLATKPNKDAILIEVPYFNERIDMRDQGNLGSCTANAGDEVMSYIRNYTRRSRLQIYYESRRLEGSIDQDAGAYNRDVMKVLSTLGAGREAWWTYDDGPDKFRQDPPLRVDRDALKRKIADYYRLDNDEGVQTKCHDAMGLCLAEGFPFLGGATLYTRFIADDVAGHGIIAMPNLQLEREEGGHAFTLWGRHMAFQSHPWAIWAMQNGLSKSLIPDQAYLCRNHWRDWGLPSVPQLGAFQHWGGKSNFVMPIQYIEDQDLADDFWTFRNVKPTNSFGAETPAAAA